MKEIEPESIGLGEESVFSVWVVVGETGEYSDYSEWNVAAFTTESEAINFKEECERETSRISGGTKNSPRLREGFRHAYDTQFHMDYTGTSYRVDMVEVFESFTKRP